MRVIHVIVSLYDGGAQAVLFSLLSSDSAHSHTVISLTGAGKYSEKIVALGVPVHHLNMPIGRVNVSGILGLYKLIKTSKPDTIQTWMYHSDLLGGVISRLLGYKNIVWGIHHTTLDKKGTSRTTRIIVGLLAKLSGFVPKKIISCSRKAIDVHTEAGYDASKLVFVGNGYDLKRFQPSEGSLSSISLSPERVQDHLVFATVARWNPQKDQRNLIDACRLLADRLDKPFLCLLIGPNVDSENDELVSYIEEANLSDRVLLCGSSSDVPAVMNAIDFHVLPSAFGEAFPNVVAEAMSCGTPCVVTDVGDAAEMVGDTGWVVAPKDANALAQAIESAMNEIEKDESWARRKTNCRTRAIENFDVRQMVAGYEDVWES